MIGIVMIGLEGVLLTASEVRRLKHPMAGGVLLLPHNCEDKAQLTHLTEQIHEINPNLIIAIDQEGGRVQRLKGGYTKIPAMGVLGEIYQSDKEAARQYARDCATVIAFELWDVGITLSFTPVLDLARGSIVIGDRSFSKHPEVVTDLATQLIDGLQEYGMVAVGKHFPGHGSVKQDTHHDIVHDHRTVDEIEKSDMQPFMDLIGAQKLHAIMTAHVIYPAVDDAPASLSAQWLGRILRQQLAFNGMIFSDELRMGGASKPNAKRLRAAFEAGCNMVIINYASNSNDSYIDSIMNGLKDGGAQQYCERTSACWDAVRQDLPAAKQPPESEYQAACARLDTAFNKDKDVS